MLFGRDDFFYSFYLAPVAREQIVTLKSPGEVNYYTF